MDQQIRLRRGPAIVAAGREALLADATARAMGVEVVHGERVFASPAQRQEFESRMRVAKRSGAR